MYIPLLPYCQLFTTLIACTPLYITCVDSAIIIAEHCSVFGRLPYFQLSRFGEVLDKTTVPIPFSYVFPKLQLLFLVTAAIPLLRRYAIRRLAQLESRDPQAISSPGYSSF